ncbi:hypothetical protein Efla_000629 [Eimeria flavescens]
MAGHSGRRIACALARAATAGWFFITGTLSSEVESEATSATEWSGESAEPEPLPKTAAPLFIPPYEPDESVDDFNDGEYLLASRTGVLPLEGDGAVKALYSTSTTFIKNCSLGGLDAETGNDALGIHEPDFLSATKLAYFTGPDTFSYRHRRLSSGSLTDSVSRLTQRLNKRYEEARGQNNLAKLVFKIKVYTWLAQKTKKLRKFLQSLFPSQTDDTTILQDGISTLPVKFTRELLGGGDFMDLLAEEGDRAWVGRFYLDRPGQDASAVMEKDFAILNCAPADESIESFRHRMRLDIPVELYTIETAGSYLKALRGEVFLNAVAKRPLIQATSSQVLKWFLKKLRNTKKGKSSLLSMSQQAVTAVSNLNRMSLVHTNINPNVFLITQKGLVFLGGLHQALTAGSQLPATLKIEPGYTPPELQAPKRTATRATFEQDAWELGLTLFAFWCGELPKEEAGEAFNFPVDTSGNIDFYNCSVFMPDEIRDLIVALTKSNPDSRLVPEKAERVHPAMFLPTTDGSPPTMDLDQDDDGPDYLA